MSSVRWLTDLLQALQLVARQSWHRSIFAWLYVPVGLLTILLACFGVNQLIMLSSVSFPASVACLVVLFCSLLVSDKIIGDRKTRAILNVIDVPAGFALRYINVFFTPSFVLLPLSPAVGAVEFFKIMAVFLLGFVVMLSVTAWMVRALQVVTGTSKRAITERAEEMGAEDDAIPLADASRRRQDSGILAASASTAEDVISDLTSPRRVQDPSSVRATGGPPDVPVPEVLRTNTSSQTPLPLTRPQRWAAFISLNLDRITYASLFLFVGIPVYYITGYAMPAQLTFNVLAYFSALSLPARWRQFLHPVLVSSAITILGIWILGIARGDSLHDVLDEYKTHTTYVDLWSGEKNLSAPGAGDVLVSVLDASIVSFVLPLYQYKAELLHHGVAIFVPNIIISIGSLFGYPALCYAIGISSKRSLAFAARSLTLALATPAVSNLRGDLSTVAILAIMSGILGVLIGPRMLKWLRIPEDDYVTRGVTLGGNSSAIATALLLVSDPRAAALSSLSMTLFGIMTLALTSVPPIVRAVNSLVDM